LKPLPFLHLEGNGNGYENGNGNIVSHKCFVGTSQVGGMGEGMPDMFGVANTRKFLGQ